MNILNMKPSFLLLLLVLSAKSLACTCLIETPDRNYLKFEYVFFGEVEKVIEFYGNSDYPKTIKVKILENFKTSVPQIITIAEPDGMCPIPKPIFKGKYVFYVDSNEGKSYIGGCNPTRNVYPWYNEVNDFDHFGLEQLRLIKQAKFEFKEELNFNFVIRNYFGSLGTFGLSKALANFNPDDYDRNVGLYLVKFLDDGKTIDQIVVYSSLGSQVDDSVKAYCFSEDFWRYQIDVKIKHELGNKLIIPILVQKPLKKERR